MRKQQSRKVIAFILTLSMVLSMVSTGVGFAQGNLENPAISSDSTVDTTTNGSISTGEALDPGGTTEEAVDPGETTEEALDPDKEAGDNTTEEAVNPGETTEEALDSMQSIMPLALLDFSKSAEVAFTLTDADGAVIQEGDWYAGDVTVQANVKETDKIPAGYHIDSVRYSYDTGEANNQKPYGYMSGNLTSESGVDYSHADGVTHTGIMVNQDRNIGETTFTVTVKFKDAGSGTGTCGYTTTVKIDKKAPKLTEAELTENTDEADDGDSNLLVKFLSFIGFDMNDQGEEDKKANRHIQDLTVSAEDILDYPTVDAEQDSISGTTATGIYSGVETIAFGFSKTATESGIITDKAMISGLTGYVTSEEAITGDAVDAEGFINITQSALAGKGEAKKALNAEFDGYVVVKAVDRGGNYAIKFLKIITDGKKATSSITYITTKTALGIETTGTGIYEILRDEEEMPTDSEPEISQNWAMNDISVFVTVTDPAITSEVTNGKYGETQVSYILTNELGTSTGGILTKAAVENTTPMTYINESTSDGSIQITEEGRNKLEIIMVDPVGNESTDTYYFWIDKKKPVAEITIEKLEDKVSQFSLFNIFGDTETASQVAIDLEDSYDTITSGITESNLHDYTESGNECITGAGVEESVMTYQYRIVSKSDIVDGIVTTPVPWKNWISSSSAIVDVEFDGIVEVRVQDKAGNWSEIASTSIMTDSTAPEVTITGTAVTITDVTTPAIEDRIFNNETGTLKKTEKWSNQSALWTVKVTDLNKDNENFFATGLQNICFKIVEDNGDSTSPSSIQRLEPSIFLADKDGNKVTNAAFTTGIAFTNGKENIIDMSSEDAIDLYFTEDSVKTTTGEAVDDLGDDIIKTKYNEAEFYLLYEGTGTIQLDVIATDEVGNKIDYATEGDAASNRAKLKVDRVNPLLSEVELEATDDDLDLWNEGDDSFWGKAKAAALYLFNLTPEPDLTTNKKINISYTFTDEADNNPMTTTEVAVSDKGYIDQAGTSAASIQYLLVPMRNEEAVDTSGFYTNGQIEAFIATRAGVLDAVTSSALPPLVTDGQIQWKNLTQSAVGGATTGEGIVVENQFQGVVILKIQDNAGNYDLAVSEQFVADSQSPDILLENVKVEGSINAANNYGWTKQITEGYTQIFVREPNADDVESGLDPDELFVTVTKPGSGTFTTTPQYIAGLVPSGASTDIENNANGGKGTSITLGTMIAEDRDHEGWYPVGFVKISESATISVNATDKVGNMHQASREIKTDDQAPIVDVFDIVKLYDTSSPAVGYNNGLAINLKAHDFTSGAGTTASQSGIAPLWGSNRNYEAGDKDSRGYNFGNNDTSNPNRFEIPGLQYALIPYEEVVQAQAESVEKIDAVKATLEKIDPWNFKSVSAYGNNGYYQKMGTPMVWHNWMSATTPAITDDFHGIVVVRAVDRAGNITILGAQPIINITANKDWANSSEQQWLQTVISRTTENAEISYEGSNVGQDFPSYMGNNALLNVEWKYLKGSTEDYQQPASIMIANEGVTAVVINAAQTEDVNRPQDCINKNTEEGTAYIGNLVEGYDDTFIEDTQYMITPIKIDRTKPEITGMAITDGNHSDEDTDTCVEVKFTATDLFTKADAAESEKKSHIASGLKTYEYSLDGINWVAIDEQDITKEEVDENGYKDRVTKANVSVDIMNPIPENFNGTISARVTDSAGNQAIASKEFVEDETAPLIQLTAPTGWQKENISVRVDVSKGNIASGISAVYYAMTTGTAITEEDLVALPLHGGNILVEKEGETQITVYAKNSTGQVVVSKSAIIQLDKTTPTISEFALSAGETEPTSGDVTLTFAAVDTKDGIATAGIDKLYYALVSKGTQPEWKAWDQNQTSMQLTGTFDGQVMVKAVDNAGNVTVETKNLTIDKTNPLISINAPKGWNSTSVLVPVIISNNDPSSKIKSVTYEGDNGLTSGSLTLNGGTILVSNDGITNITVTATNAAGVETIATATVKIHYIHEVAMPTVDLTTIDWTNVGTIKVTKPTAPSTVKTYYSLNGKAWEELTGDTVTLNKNGENVLKLKAVADDICKAESNINTINMKYDSSKPVVNVSYPSDWVKDSATIHVVAEMGDSVSPLKKLSYKIGAKEYSLPVNGGTILINDNGITTIDSITLTNQAGNQYVVDAFSVKVDKKAPTASFNLEVTGDLALMRMADVNANKQLKLVVDAGKTKDLESGIQTYEYAINKKGVSAQNWIAFDPGENPTVINKAFDGSVSLRVTDAVGNQTIVSKSVFTEGIAPEIGIIAPSTWQAQTANVAVNVVDKGLSAGIDKVSYKLTNKSTAGAVATTTRTGELPSVGGTIEVTQEGISTVEIIAVDYAGNTTMQTTNVLVDKSAPTFTGVTNNSTYNKDVTMSAVTDQLSGIQSVTITHTSGDNTSVSRNVQESYGFTDDGVYAVEMVDKVGNYEKVTFTMAKNLKNVINIVEVDQYGRVKIEVLSGEKVTFYQNKNNTGYVTTDVKAKHIWIEKTGVYGIYGVDANGKTTNTLNFIVSRSSAMAPDLIPSVLNRDVYVDVTENTMITRIKEVLKGTVNDSIYNGSNAEVHLQEDGVYVIQ